jgi:hypothetical protein
MDKPTSADVKAALVQVTVVELVDTVHPLAVVWVMAQAPLQNSVTGDGHESAAAVRPVTTAVEPAGSSEPLVTGTRYSEAAVPPRFATT